MVFQWPLLQVETYVQCLAQCLVLVYRMCSTNANFFGFFFKIKIFAMHFLNELCGSACHSVPSVQQFLAADGWPIIFVE